VVQGSNDTIQKSTCGTPHHVVQELVRRVGIGSNLLHSVQLCGDLFHAETDAPQAYDNILDELGLRLPVGTLSVNELALHDFEFAQISPTLPNSVRPSSLQVLRIKNCLQLPALLEQLMAFKHELDLRIFEFRDLCHEESMDSGEVYGINNFCRSFSNLRSFTLEVSGDWEDFDYNCLSSHTELETCILSLGRRNFTMDAVRILRGNHPTIKTFGLRAWNLLGSHKTSVAMPEEGAAWLGRLAKEVVQFVRLEQRKVIRSPYQRSTAYEDRAILARDLHASYTEASSGRTVREVVLGLREIRYPIEAMDTGVVNEDEVFRSDL